VMTVAIAKKAEVVFIENLQLFCKRAQGSRFPGGKRVRWSSLAETPNGLGADRHSLGAQREVKPRVVTIA